MLTDDQVILMAETIGDRIADKVVAAIISATQSQYVTVEEWATMHKMCKAKVRKLFIDGDLKGDRFGREIMILRIQPMEDKVKLRKAS